MRVQDRDHARNINPITTRKLISNGDVGGSILIEITDGRGGISKRHKSISAGELPAFFCSSISADDEHLGIADGKVHQGSHNFREAVSIHIADHHRSVADNVRVSQWPCAGEERPVAVEQVKCRFAREYDLFASIAVEISYSQ